MVEQSARTADGVQCCKAGPRAARGSDREGQDLARGAAVLHAGHRVRASDLALLASVGCEPVPVIAQPRVIVLTTGDELVPSLRRPRRRPDPREQHAAARRALGRRARFWPRRRARRARGVVRGARLRAARMRRAASRPAASAVGRYDLVGAALAELGVEPVLHKVAIKPGQAVVVRDGGEDPGLRLAPGNQVSCLVNHEVFVRPALQRLGGETGARTALRRGRWRGRGAHIDAAPRTVSARSASSPAPTPWSCSSPCAGKRSADVAGRPARAKHSRWCRSTRRCAAENSSVRMSTSPEAGAARTSLP